MFNVMVKSKYGVVQLSHATKILSYVTVHISALAQNQSTPCISNDNWHKIYRKETKEMGRGVQTRS